MQTILVPLDGSDLASRALPYARLLATTFAARIALHYVVSQKQRRAFLSSHPSQWTTDEAPLEGQEDEPDERLFEPLRQEGEAYLAGVAAELRAVGFETTTNVTFGHPPLCISDVAESRAADLIAMVTHNRVGVSQWFESSVTEELVCITPRPIFVIREALASQEQPPVLPRRILVPIDKSERSAQALPVAQTFVERTGAALDLVHVVSSSSEQATAEAHLNEVIKTLPATSAEVHPHVAVGKPAESILESTQRLQADLVVMATSRHRGLRHLFETSVTDAVLHATNVPMVILHTR